MYKPGTHSTAALLAVGGLGSPIIETNNAQSTRFSYTPFGYSSRANGKPGFLGEVKEPGLQYLLGNGYRGYSPELMRFSMPDALSPFGKGGLNSYAYCNDQPITLRDPQGRFAIGAAFAITSLLAAIGLEVAAEVFKSSIGEKTLYAMRAAGGILTGVGVAGSIRQIVRTKSVSRANPSEIPMQIMNIRQ